MKDEQSKRIAEARENIDRALGSIRGWLGTIENMLIVIRDQLAADVLQHADGALAVPYRSQWDDDASFFASDCGPASLAMVLEFCGVKETIDKLAHEAGMNTAKRYTVGGDLVATAAKHGVKLQHRFDAPLPVIEAEVNAGRPVIVLLHYGTLKDHVDDKTYTAGHWLVVTGVNADSIIVNDPNFRRDRRNYGFNLQIPRAVFEQAMRDNALDGNRANQAVFVVPNG